MLAKLIAASPGLTAAHAGPAEALPLTDASADIVTAGQAFHWFDRSRALPEIRRVLRPEGLLAPIWNVRDDATGWVGALTEAIGSSQGERDALAATEPGYFGRDFAEPEYRVFRHERPLDRAGAPAASSSPAPTTSPPTTPRRNASSPSSTTSLDTHPDLRGKDSFAMPYNTYAFKVRPA